MVNMNINRDPTNKYMQNNADMQLYVMIRTNPTLKYLYDRDDIKIPIMKSLIFKMKTTKV